MSAIEAYLDFAPAISANPGEDLVRLAWADRLEDAVADGWGPPEWGLLAEWVRKSIELHNGPDGIDKAIAIDDPDERQQWLCKVQALDLRLRSLWPAVAPQLGLRGTLDAPSLDVGECPECGGHAFDTVSMATCIECHASGRRLLPCTLQRGLVGGVTVGTVAEFVGERCRTCAPGNQFGWTPKTCPFCEGDVYTGGLVASVTVPTAAEFVGERCETCGGQGKKGQEVEDANGDADWAVSDCPQCAGVGYVGGLAAAIGKRCPGVTAVVLADRVPHHDPVGFSQAGRSGVYWCRGPGTLPDNYRPHDLHRPLFDCLEGWIPKQPSHLRFYPSVNSALSALRKAAALYAKKYVC